MNNYITATINKHNLNIGKNKNQVIDLIANHIEILIFNIISIASIITMLNNSTIITSNAINHVKNYIHNNYSNKLTGGTSLPSEYFGYNSGIYNDTNNLVDVLNVDFASGILRNQIGGGGGKKNISNEWINNKINKLLKYYNLSASKTIINSLINIIMVNINNFFKQIKDEKLKVITINSIKKMIKSNKNMDIFK
jgi:hypothetical protein